MWKPSLIRLGLAGSRHTASKSITPSKAPLVRIQALTARRARSPAGEKVSESS